MQFFADLGIERNRRGERLRADVKAIGNQIFCRALVDGGFFFRRNSGLKLRDNSLNDVALNRKDISQIAFVAFFPCKNATTGIGQLRGNAYFLTALADTSFQDEGDAYGLSYLGPVSSRSRHVLLNLTAVNDLKVLNSGKGGTMAI